MPTQLLSVTEVAALLSCSRGHVYDLIAAGYLAAYDIGSGTRSKTRVRDDDLARFVAARLMSAEQPGRSRPRRH